MNTAKKWMVTLGEEKYDWVKTLSQEADISGSAIIEEALALAMRDKTFEEGLIETKRQIKLRELNEKKLTLEEEIKVLKQKNVLAKAFA